MLLMGESFREIVIQIYIQTLLIINSIMYTPIIDLCFIIGWVWQGSRLLALN